MGPPMVTDYWSRMVDMLILDRFEIGCSQKMISGVIFDGVTNDVNDEDDDGVNEDDDGVDDDDNDDDDGVHDGDDDGVDDGDDYGIDD